MDTDHNVVKAWVHGDYLENNLYWLFGDMSRWSKWRFTNCYKSKVYSSNESYYDFCRMKRKQPRIISQVKETITNKSLTNLPDRGNWVRASNKSTFRWEVKLHAMHVFAFPSRNMWKSYFFSYIVLPLLYLATATIFYVTDFYGHSIRNVRITMTMPIPKSKNCNDSQLLSKWILNYKNWHVPKNPSFPSA